MDKEGETLKRRRAEKRNPIEYKWFGLAPNRLIE
jgi:hypothetical protein